MNNENIGTFAHRVYTYHTRDSFGNIPLHKLLPLILDSAGQHAEILGFAKDFLLEQNYTWVLSRINMELENLVADLEMLYIDTWISVVKSAFSVRLFEIHDGQGTRIAYGSSYWSIISTKTRKIAPIQDIIGDKSSVNAREIPCNLPQKIVLERGELVAQQIAEYTDLDYNGHTNSNRYVEWVINTFSLDFWKKHKLVKLTLNYNQEVYWEDEIYIFKKQNGNVVHVELYNKTQETTACKMRLEFVAM